MLYNIKDLQSQLNKHITSLAYTIEKVLLRPSHKKNVCCTPTYPLLSPHSYPKLFWALLINKIVLFCFVFLPHECLAIGFTELYFSRSELYQLGRVKRIWYLSPMRAAKVQASLRIRAVSPEPPLLAHTSSESRGTFRQKARSLASLNGWACAVKTCHDGMLEDTNSLDGAQLQ